MKIVTKKRKQAKKERKREREKTLKGWT